MATCLGLLTPSLARSADDDVAAKEILILKLPRSGASTPAPAPDARPPVAASVKSNGIRSADPKFTEDSLNLEAGKIIERATTGGDSAKADRIIELHTDVRLALQDGPMSASAERATVTIRYESASRTTIKSVTVELRDAVQWSFDGIGASADRLTLSFRPSLQSKATEPRPTRWTVRGRARLKGKNFAARADRVELARDDDTAGQGVRLVLDGHAVLKYAGKGGRHGQTDGNRIEWRQVEHGIIPVLSDLMDGAFDGRMRR